MGDGEVFAFFAAAPAPYLGEPIRGRELDWTWAAPAPGEGLSQRLAVNGVRMRAKQKENLLASIQAGEAECDCGSLATRIDEAGKPECQRCHDLNEMAQIFHDKLSMMNPQ